MITQEQIERVQKMFAGRLLWELYEAQGREIERLRDQVENLLHRMTSEEAAAEIERLRYENDSLRLRPGTPGSFWRGISAECKTWQQRAEQAEARLARVMDAVETLHKLKSYPSLGRHDCEHSMHPYPCATIRAVNAAIVAAQPTPADDDKIRLAELKAIVAAAKPEGSACADRAETVEETHKRWAAAKPEDPNEQHLRAHPEYPQAKK